MGACNDPSRLLTIQQQAETILFYLYLYKFIMQYTSKN